MDTLDLRDRTAICGVGLSAYGRRLGRSAIDLGADALRAAVDDAGLTPGDIEGLIVSFGTPIGADADTLAHTLGLRLRLYNQTWAHGRFTATCIQQAAMSVAAGLADVVACMASVSFTGARRPRVGGSGDREGAREGGGGHGEDPVYGMTSPGAGAALVARAYFERYGATSRDLASVAVAFRRHASLNPTAMLREPITVEDHQSSRLVCAPLHLLDYCQVNDGAACVIVTSAERARDLRKPAVLISGMQGLPAGRDEFIWSYPGFGIAQQESAPHTAELEPVYRMAGLERSAVDALFTYDAFSILAWIALERWGFCKPGEAAAFTQGGRIELGGELPMNTHGGLLSDGHIMGWNHQVEIVRQLRGECGERQVEGARVVQWANSYGDSVIYRSAA